MSSSVKQRERKIQFPSGKLKDGSGKVVLKGDPVSFIGRQYTASEGHPRGRDGRYHEGGSFYTVDVRYVVPNAHVNIVHPYNGLTYSGSMYTPPLIADVSDSGIDVIRSKDTSDLDSAGATAISAISPTNPNVNIAQQVGELHQDGIKRSLPGVATWQNRTKIAKAAGSEYLSAVFGWIPLTDEMTNLAHTVRNADDYISQYNSGAGKNTRREFTYPVETTTSTSNKIQRPGLAGMSLSSEWFDEDVVPRLTEVRESTSRKWFVGAFTYATPPQGDTYGEVKNAAARANVLYGTTLTPDVVWELTPWSWAIDWFSNVGDVVNNFTNMAINGLVMRYGYMMEEQTIKVTRTIDHCGYKTIADRSAPTSVTVMSSKVRRPANPFGFGLSWDGLSPSQLLIAAALGITHLR